MMSPSQYLTPDRGRGYGGVRPGLSPRGPTDLFGGGAAGGGGAGGGGDLSSLSRLASPEFTSTPALPALQSQSQSQTFTNWVGRADQALLAPTVWQRCEELGPVLQQCPSKELATVWPTLVDRIFGLGGGRGWGLAQITRSQSARDYTALASFLSASGPLMAAGERLLADPYIRYDFPVSRLSASVVSQISSGSPSLSSYIASRLSHNLHHLSLNSFELLMFSFSVYIVQPYSLDNKLVAGESLYPFILEDYLSYYLPCDGTIPPPLPFQLPPASHSPTHNTEASPAVSTPARKSLLRHQPVAAVSRPPPPPVSSQASADSAWRSETLLNIFSCVWLTQFSSRPSSPGSGLTSSELPIPVSDTLKIVRMLIKHLHYFANSGGPQDVTPLDQLKRATLSGVKSQMYSLFKYIFSQWPHDTSFRLVLETWLSFIQPWRYTDRGRPTQDTEPAPVSPERWQLWVAEFVLFYSEIIKLLLPRFFRMDLTASRNAYMLYRIAKVFSQPGVADLVRNAEAGLDRGTKGPGDVPGLLGMPSLLEGGSLVLEQDREIVTSAARQCLLELEGHSVKYWPVFGNEFRQTVVELLAVSEKAKTAAEDMLKELGESSGGRKEEGMLSQILGWLAASGEGPDSQETEDLRKTVHHLTASMAALQEIFSVAASAPDRAGAGGLRRLTGGPGSPGQPEMVETAQGLVLTPHGRWQVVQGLARPVPRYEGDPDTRPITGQEVVWLVRRLHQASQHLNTLHGDLLARYYQDPGLLGQAARLVLAPPVHFINTTKSISGGPAIRTSQQHRARISLRTLGNKRTIVYLVLYLLVMWCLGYSTLGALIVLILLTATAVLATASVKQMTQPRPSLLDTSDYSGGDKKNL